jgi:hypothetical protein
MTYPSELIPGTVPALAETRRRWRDYLAEGVLSLGKAITAGCFGNEALSSWSAIPGT